MPLPTGARSVLCVDTTALSSGINAEYSHLQIDPSTYDQSHLLVRFDDVVASPTDYFQAKSNNAFRGMDIAASLPLASSLQKIRLGAGLTVDTAIDILQQDPNVLYAEPDYVVRVAGPATDPRFDEQWDFHNSGQTGGTLDADIDAPEAWDVTTGTGSTLVAVIDTGVDYLHPDLADNIWVNQGEIPNNGIDDDDNGYVDDVHGYDFFNEDGDPMDDNDHGTHVAGTIGAIGNNGEGIAGINWDVQIMALKFLGSDGSGTTSDAIEAIQYAIDNGAHISNNSWGGDPFSQALFDVIDQARLQSHIFVAAAGNGNLLGIGLDNDVTPFYPSGYDLDNIVAVAATDDTDDIALFSNFGTTTVDLGAPGVSILSTTRNNTYGLSSGTSMAAPHVTGALSLVRDHVPGLTYVQVIDRVLASVDLVSSLAGITVTGGRLNLAAALIPDTFGPQVVDIQPNGLTLDPLDSLNVRFDESIDPSTFTLDDIEQFTGPEGDISVLNLQAVAGTNDRQFTLSFPMQTVPGDYELTISPDILDRFGNVMDQDDDGIGGELFDDRFIGAFTLADTVARFDFGTGSSPLAAGYTRITRDDNYDSGIGYGWQSGLVFQIDRVLGDDMTRDVHYFSDSTFGLDVSNGEYDVIVTMGDTGQPHEQMGVFLEGVQVDEVDNASGETITRTYRVSVGDEQLNLRLLDLGGSDPWAVINGLDVVFAGPDLSGPRVASVDLAGTVAGPVDRIVLSFSETIDENTFTLADVVLLEGPAGTIVPAAVNRLENSQYEVVFAAQNNPGEYHLVISPDIADLSGNLMDQDGDGLGAENPDDQFETMFSLEPGPQYVGRFDFGTGSSPLAAGYTRITRDDNYDSGIGYGWQSGLVFQIDRVLGDDMTRDVHYFSDSTFGLDVSNGEYDVIVTMGDTGQPHEQMGVFLEGVQVDEVDNASGETITRTYRVSVGDEQLNLRLLDLGGSDPWAVINGLDVVFAGPDLSGPRVASVDLAGTVAGPVDRIVLSFSETIDENTFTLADVVLLEGPAGTIVPAAVNRLENSQYEVVFAAQNNPGEYHLVISPDIADLSGNLMDQDGDGLGAENPDDQFETMFSLEPGPQYVGRFDFGTGSSPLAAGYTRITRDDNYDSGIGYGWQSGLVFQIDRVLGDDMTRDVHYFSDSTFGLDVSNGEYDVIVTMGDTGQPHEQMGVFLEGVQVDEVDNASGETITRTYRVSVGDEQLNLRLLDLGGSDPWAVINGLDVVFAGPDPSASADFDANNQVDGLDFLLWQQGFGIPMPNATKVDGDADNDQDVDGDDLIVWETQYGVTTAPLTAASIAALSQDDRVAETDVQRNLYPPPDASLVDAAMAHWHLEHFMAEADDFVAEEENSTPLESLDAALIDTNVWTTNGRVAISSVPRSHEEETNDANQLAERALANDLFNRSLVSVFR